MKKTPLMDIYRVVFVYDPTDSHDEVIPIGKQTINPSHIFYTPCSGIWQSVWLEAAPANWITKLDVQADMHGEGKLLFKEMAVHPLINLHSHCVGS